MIVSVAWCCMVLHPSWAAHEFFCACVGGGNGICLPSSAVGFAAGNLGPDTKFDGTQPKFSERWATRKCRTF